MFNTQTLYNQKLHNIHNSLPSPPLVHPDHFPLLPTFFPPFTFSSPFQIFSPLSLFNLLYSSHPPFDTPTYFTPPILLSTLSTYSTPSILLSTLPTYSTPSILLSTLPTYSTPPILPLVPSYPLSLSLVSQPLLTLPAIFATHTVPSINPLTSAMIHLLLSHQH